MISNKNLKYSFSSVLVKLIPKKDDITHIKNWRPISLLSVFYKIPSSAYSNRLKRVYDKIVSQRQKAYSSKKVLQEAVIDVLDNIKKCIVNNSLAGIVLIDFRKAFDTISHNYILKSLKFFNFSDYMINVAETLLTGRCGSVLTDTGQTPNFSFDSGTPQGAPESAFFFCIALEPLLIKLKICPTIEKIEIPSRLFPTTRKTLEGVAFADDASGFIKASDQNLPNFKLILDNFFRMSCLGINVEKTTIIPIAAGNNIDFIRSIEESGFSVDSKFKLLGYKIDNKLEKLHENIECVMEKLTKISSFWSKFKLSLPGRINIYKCYMLSNINFICSVIPTRKSDFDKIDQKCFHFVNGDMQTSFKKAFSPISDGGLGLIHSYDFCIANRVGLFKRSLMSEDTWAVVMKNACHGSDPFYIDAQSPILIENPHASLIAKAYDAFYTLYI